jgi:hypothetical protein
MHPSEPFSASSIQLNPFCNKAWCKQREGKGYLDHGNVATEMEEVMAWKVLGQFRDPGRHFRLKE